MSAESILYAILSADMGVTALVADCIYPDLIPEEKPTPYIGFERVSTDPIGTLEGTVLAERVGLAVACWAETRIEANQLADAVKAALAGTVWRYSGEGSEVDEATGRLAASLQYSISL